KVEKYKERQIGFAKMQRDRFVSRDAGPAGGSLRTPPILLDGEKLSVNADVKGELHIRVLDETGAAIPGFDASAPIHGDSLAHEIRWNQSLAALKAKPLRLEFLMRDARLYVFELV